MGVDDVGTVEVTVGEDVDSYSLERTSVDEISSSELEDEVEMSIAEEENEKYEEVDEKVDDKGEDGSDDEGDDEDDDDTVGVHEEDDNDDRSKVVILSDLDELSL